MLGQSTAYISLENLRHNLAVLRSKLRPQTRIMAAVKADAYGHGAEEVGSCLYKEGVRDFAVACLDEALKLRAALPEDAEILVLGFTFPELAPQLCQYRITQTLLGEDYTRALAAVCRKQNLRVQVHLALDTGMGRIGFRSPQQAAAAAKLPQFLVTGAFTHFSCADGDDEAGRRYTQEQFRLFEQWTHALQAAGIALPHLHCNNSAAIFKYPEYQLNMVRAGIVLYGLSPSGRPEPVYRDLRPCMQLRSVISHVKEIPAGAHIGYGADFTAPRPMRIATVACGYADGYRRSLGKGYVLVCGKKAPLVGRVCMDQLMIDVTEIDTATFLTPVTLFGEDSGQVLSADVLAGWADTISYELLSDIARRVHRVYI